MIMLSLKSLITVYDLFRPLSVLHARMYQNVVAQTKWQVALSIFERKNLVRFLLWLVMHIRRAGRLLTRRLLDLPVMHHTEQ